jgi:predicted CoA-binding protein
MPKIDTLVQEFFAQKKIAVVGVSDKRETGCNLAYR